MSLTKSFTPLVIAVKANPRLRVGLWIIMGVFWLYALLLLRDENRLALTEYQTLARKVVQLQAQSSQTEWTARAESAQALQLALEGRLWREGTIGLAQATFQDWLNQVMQQANLPRGVVTVAAQEENAPENNATVRTESGLNSDLWKVSAKVGFDFTPKNLNALLDRIESHEKQIIVENLVVRGAPIPRVDMVLVAYFQKAASLEKVNGANSGKTIQTRP